MEKVGIENSKKISFPLLWESFFLALLVFVLHYFAIIYHLYWTISWFDILMHFLGGFLISLLAICFCSRINIFDFGNQNKVTRFFIVISITLIIGLAWELWEIFMGFSDQLRDAPDTILDIIMDIVGAITAFIYANKSI